MTMTMEITTTRKLPPDPTRKAARVAGVLYLVTFVTSIPALILYGPLLNHSDYILGGGADSQVLLGALLEVLCALAGIGTAVALYPVVKRQNEAVALGFVTSRVVEAGMIMLGLVSLLSVVTLRQSGTSGADAASFVTTGKALVAIHDWTFLFGPGVMPGINALLLGTLLYRSRLVPRIIPVMGLAGAPLLLGFAIAVLFGACDQVSGWSVPATALIFCWELSLGLWMTFKGFRPAPITAAPPLPR